MATPVTNIAGGAAPEPRQLDRAALVGLGGGLRSCAPLVVLAQRGLGPFPGAARLMVFGAAMGELIADKQPDMTSRISSRGLTMRIGFSGNAGYMLAGWSGAGIAAAAAVLRCGRWLAPARTGARTARPVGGGAMVEDATSYVLVLASMRAVRSTTTSRTSSALRPVTGSA